MNDKLAQTNTEETPPQQKESRPRRRLMIFKSIVLLALLSATGYGMVDQGLYNEQLWLPVAAVILGLLVITLFVSDYFRDTPTAGWVLVGLMSALVAIKGLSMTWTLSNILTVEELIRSAMYLTTFLLVLGALSARWQAGPLMDLAALTVVPVCGYGLLQKVSPIKHPVTSFGGVRVDSTLGYANTTAVVLGMGALLLLARMTQVRNAVVRGVYAVLTLAFLTTLYLTVSRGGLASTVIGIVVLFILTGKRLQTLANLVLLAIPGFWLLWQIQNTRGLLESVPDQQKLQAGATFRTDLLIALAAAFVLQAGYALLANRHELTPKARRTVGIIAAACVVLLFAAGAGAAAVKYGGIGQLYSAAANNPDNTANVTQRLTSASIGFRKDYWKVAWEEWQRRPLRGTGAGTFQLTWLKYRPTYTGVKQVHNVYLEQGTETGVFAFLALTGFAVLLVAYTARAAWRASPQGDRRLFLAGLVAVAVTYLISSIFEWHWYLPPSTLLFFILAGAAAKLASKTAWDPTAEEAHQKPE